MKVSILLFGMFGVGALLSFVRADSPDDFEVGTPEMGKTVVETETPKPRIGDRFRSIFPKKGEAKSDESSVGTIVGDADSAKIDLATPPHQAQSEAFWLKKIAAALSIHVTDDDQPDNIAFKIEQRLLSAEKYKGGVMSEESAANIKEAIVSDADAEIFAAYHAFIQKIAGKKLLILDNEN